MWIVAASLLVLTAATETVVGGVAPLTVREALFFGSIGGVFGVLADLFAWQKIPEDERPWWFGKRLFWLSNIFLLPACGATLSYAWVRSGAALTAILAINLGISAPLVINRLSLAAPVPNPGKVAD